MGGLRLAVKNQLFYLSLEMAMPLFSYSLTLFPNSLSLVLNSLSLSLSLFPLSLCLCLSVCLPFCVYLAVCSSLFSPLSLFCVSYLSFSISQSARVGRLRVHV